MSRHKRNKPTTRRHAVDPASSYDVIVRTLFEEALDEIGTHEAAGVALARSRTARRSLRFSGGMHPARAEALRSRVCADVLVDRGLSPLRAGLDLTPIEDVVEDEVRLPRGRALDGERVRRGGRR